MSYQLKPLEVGLMIAILCLDSQNGLMFGGRRQSRDRLLLEDIRQFCEGKALLMNEYSNRLFLQYGFQYQRVLPDFLSQAGPGDICFIEGNNLVTLMDSLEKLVLYCWNRVYPADLYFDPSLLNGWHLLEQKEFPGSSHERLTRKVYER